MERMSGGDEYGRAKGIKLVEALVDGGRFVFTTAEAQVEGQRLGLSPGSILVTLTTLAKAGWILRLRRGLYATTGTLPGGLELPAFAIATALVTPSAISHWSALSHHHLTDQIPRTVTAMTPRRVVLPTMRHGARTGARHTWTVGTTTVEYVTVNPRRFFGTEEVWLDDRFKAPITDRERTVLELFVSPRHFGGLGEALGVLEEHRASLDLPKLVRYGVAIGVASVAKRLGYSLERAGVDAAVLEPLRAVPSQSVCVLDPTRPKTGRRVAAWSLVDNLTPA